MKWEEYYEKYYMWSEGIQYGRLSSITDFGAETSPAREIVDCVQFVDERTAKRILKLALTSGVRFTSNQVVEIVENAVQDARVLDELIKASDCFEYSGEDIVRIFDSILDERPVLQLLEEICKKKNKFTDIELLEIIERLGDTIVINKLLEKSTCKFTEDTLNQICDLGIDDNIIKVISKRSNIPFFDPDENWDWDLDEIDSDPLEEKSMNDSKNTTEYKSEDNLAYRSENDREYRSENNEENRLKYKIEKNLKGNFKKWVNKKHKKKNMGILTVIAAMHTIERGFSNSKRKDKGVWSGVLNSKSSDIRRCRGNCASCPPHYGYRYGRWYYGHSHSHGCEFGGNNGDGRD